MADEMKAAPREGSLDAPFRHPIAWRDEAYYDMAAIEAEMERVFDICHGCRRCFNLCDSFPKLFDMVDESPTGELFLSGTLKKSVSQFRAYWKRLLFSGGGAVPKVFRNHDQLLDFVARQPGAIGIVEASAVDDRVRVLEISN